MSRKDKLFKLFSQCIYVIRQLFLRFKEHNISFSGGQIAYFFILSLFPFLIFANSLIASFNIPVSSAISFLKPFFPSLIIDIIAQYITYINSRSVMSLLSFGILLAVFSSSKSVRSLIFAFDLAYDTKQKRGFFSGILFSMLFILLFALMLLACIVLVAFGNDFVTGLMENSDIAFAFIDLFAIWKWITVSGILYLIMTVIYKVLPSARVRFSETVPGSVFSLVCILSLTALFSAYINRFVSPDSFYGSIGAIILLMLWMYFSGIILILGAELNKLVSDMKSSRKS